MYSTCSCDQRIVTHNELSTEVNVHVNLHFLDKLLSILIRHTTVVKTRWTPEKSKLEPTLGSKVQKATLITL